MVKVIGEIGSNYNQDIKRAFQLIKQAKFCGLYGVKFQLFTAETLYKNKKIQNQIRDRELKTEWLPLIANECKKYDLKFICTPFYEDAVKELEPYVDWYKISSFDILRLDLIMKCLKTKKPTMISLGLADQEDILRLVNIISESHIPREKIVFMHCISKYPTKFNETCMGRLTEIISLYDHVGAIGYSDHSADIVAILSAAMNGVEYITNRTSMYIIN